MTDITIPSSDRRSGPYTATAAQTTFTYDFPIYDEADLVVVRRRAGAETVLELTTHYTVTGVGVQEGGTAELVAGSEEGDIVTVYGAQPRARTSNFQPPPSGPTAADLNRDLNKIMATLQEITRDLARCVRLKVTDADNADLSLPIAAARANKALGFDGSGNLTVLD